MYANSSTSVVDDADRGGGCAPGAVVKRCGWQPWGMITIGTEGGGLTSRPLGSIPGGGKVGGRRARVAATEPALRGGTADGKKWLTSTPP